MALAFQIVGSLWRKPRLRWQSVLFGDIVAYFSAITGRMVEIGLCCPPGGGAKRRCGRIACEQSVGHGVNRCGQEMPPAPRPEAFGLLGQLQLGQVRGDRAEGGQRIRLGLRSTVGRVVVVDQP